MQFFDLTLESAALNLALDEALLLQAESGALAQILRFWEWPHDAVILGSACKRAEDADVAACERDQVPIIRRSSGGGTVLLGRGSLCFSVILPMSGDLALNEIRSSYVIILDRLIEAFALPGLALEGICDLSQHGRKFSGNAQQRKRTHLLHHGTILYDFDLSRVSRYLRMPERRPEYRADRPHDDFLCNLQVSREWLIQRIVAAWNAEPGPSHIPQEKIAELMKEKYGNEQWHERR
jgi:lipoate-protein ligase A